MKREAYLKVIQVVITMVNMEAQGAVAEEADHESANEGIPLVSCATDDEVDYQLPNIVL